MENETNDAAKNPRYDEWRVFQGREDAEMLSEKARIWKNEREWKEKSEHNCDD